MLQSVPRADIAPAIDRAVSSLRRLDGAKEALILLRGVPANDGGAHLRGVACVAAALAVVIGEAGDAMAALARNARAMAEA